MKIYLLTGFLGSGKSTYLNNILLNSTRKTGVLINEFGKISVDTITLYKKGTNIIELTNGSIFCSCLKDKFIDGLAELIKMPLDEIFIESSGLSDPSNMGSIVQVLKKQVQNNEFEFSGVICLVDAMFFLKQIDVLESIRRQIRHSHIIIINKIDLVGEKQIENIKQIVKDINPKAQIGCTSFGKLVHSHEDIISFDIAPEHTINTTSSKPMSMILEFIKPYSINLIKEFFIANKDYLYRAKGYVLIEGKFYKVDIVNEMIKIDLVDDTLTIKPEEINKIVLLLSRGTDSIKYILRAVNNDFYGKVKC